MDSTLSRTPKPKQPKPDSWPRKVQPGRAVVTVYRRKTPVGNWAYMVANYVEHGKRRFDSFSDETDALEAAEQLAKRIDARDYVAAALTRDQAIEYANALTRLRPFNVSVDAATSAVAECLKTVGDLPNLHAAVQFFAQRHKKITPKRVADVVNELISIKEARGAASRYVADLHYRLDRFAESFGKDIGNVTTPEIQEWLDGQKLAPQSYMNFQRVLHLLFKFAVARGYCLENPVAGAEKVKVRNRDVAIFKPAEIARLLAAASPDFVPCLALGAFAGLRTAEIQRLEFCDIDLPGRLITVGASKSKTASRRIVPISDNLAQWLQPYAGREGRVFAHESEFPFHRAQRSAARATEVEADAEGGVKAEKPVKWKSNALRHSYASYRFAQTGDAGRVAGELGNSATVVHRHYRELVKPSDAEAWFNVRPEGPANILNLPAADPSEEVAVVNQP